MVGPADKRVAAGHLIQTHSVSQYRVCRLLQLHRSVARYQRSARSDDPALEKRLKALAEQHPRYGYCLLHGMLKNEGLVRELDQLARTRPLPGTIVLDNGPELTSKAMFSGQGVPESNCTSSNLISPHRMPLLSLLMANSVIPV